jgi:hypothetical protein
MCRSKDLEGDSWPAGLCNISLFAEGPQIAGDTCQVLGHSVTGILNCTFSFLEVLEAAADVCSVWLVNLK